MPDTTAKSTSVHESFAARKARLRQAFVAQIPERLEDARRTLASTQDTPAEHPRLEALFVLFHTLKGAAATFGLSALSAAAQQAEHRVRTAMESGAGMDASLLAELTGQLELMAVLHRQAITEEAPKEGRSFGLAAPKQRPGRTPDRSRRLIYLCDDDPQFGAQLAAQLACFGYRVESHTDLDSLVRAVERERPAAMILDVVFPESAHAGPNALADLNARLGGPIPCIFMSARDDFQARLEAVRSGGSAFCTKPIKTVEMLEFLDRLTNPSPPEPINVLVVDDDRELAELHATVLEEAGMVAKAVTDPKGVPRLLECFDADLVLMDMYMPDCSGPELSRILRQMPGHVSLPIIYVSSETDVERQLTALAVGADGFLTKPIDPARLVVEVTLRAERMRILRSLMVRDGLTGLFNHNATMQFLEVAMANARRGSTSLAFAMIDVDHFKVVNDTYGHPTGDQVLMALSRTLRLRLRDNDLVGRYGGEEFAVVLTGVDAVQARAILNGLRTSFAAITFYADDREFRCTFSVGVALFPTFERPDTITEAADRALYRAKRGGRNRVELATAEGALVRTRQGTHRGARAQATPDQSRGTWETHDGR